MMVRPNAGGNNPPENPFDDGQGLGPHLVGKQVEINGRSLSIHKQLGEGGFSFVYLVRDCGNGNPSTDDAVNSSAAVSVPQHSNLDAQKKAPSTTVPPRGTPMVLKITSVHTSAQRLMAEKEAKLLRTLSHPSIIQVYDDGFREENGASSADDNQHVNSGNNNNEQQQHQYRSNNNSSNNISNNRSLQHLILMEYCEGGTAFDAIKRMRANNLTIDTTNISHSSSTPAHLTSTQFDLPSLVIAFGQICNAVSYLHAQRPPVIHRDLKPVNFLIKNNSYKLCDFGSAVLGHTDLRTPENRRKAEEVVAKTTTQMFRAPEMVDLYMSKRLTQSTDVWALGCCLYSLAFLRDCFEEGSNLAILSKKYKIPQDNPYGDGLVDLIDRMLTVDYKERADMSEVIMCLSALYSGRDLPKRKKKEGGGERVVVSDTNVNSNELISSPRVGAYRTDGQGIRIEDSSPIAREKKVLEAKKLNPNSAAAKRKKASETNKQKEMAILNPSLVSSANTTSGKKSSASASTRSETPISDSGDVGNFASFDQVFEDNFDPFTTETTTKSDGDEIVEIDSLMGQVQITAESFLAFENQRQCSTSTLPLLQQQSQLAANNNTMTSNQAADSSFEVTFPGFDSTVPSVFSTSDYYFSSGVTASNNNETNINDNDGFGNMTNQEESTAIPSPTRKFFNFGNSNSNVNNNSNEATPVNHGSTAKKKRSGVFGMLGKR